MPNRLASPAEVDAARRAAFHGRPGDGITVLSRTALGPEGTWLLGVCQASAGSFGQALRTVEPLVSGQVGGPRASSAERRVYAGLGLTTMASVYRQIAAHTRGRAADERALELLRGGPWEFDAQLGLAADAVGIGDVDAAQHRWDLARGVMDRNAWRPAVRLAWVQAEIGLLRGSAELALAAARRAVRGSVAADAPRHEAKSLLFTGVCELVAGEGEPAQTFRRSAQIADRLELLPLMWPVHKLLATIDGDTRVALHHRTKAANAIHEIRNDLPEALAQAWALDPAVQELLETA